MTVFDLIAILLTYTALLSYVNDKVFRVPETIGLLILSLGAALLFLIAEWLGVAPFADSVKKTLVSIDFNQTMMQGFLSYLLFAGALGVSLKHLRVDMKPVLILSTIGVLISTVLFGSAIYFVFEATNQPLSFVYCLLFGALLSPTDPIAVLSIVRSLELPKSLETILSGESLLNDGVGAVLFLSLYGVAAEGGTFSVLRVFEVFMIEAVGGAFFGLVLGWSAYLLTRSIDNYKVEVLLTLAIVTGGYALASVIGVSGPLAMVVAGIIVGNKARKFTMSEQTQDSLDHFWEMVESIINAVLFVLIGLEILVLPFQIETLWIGMGAIILLLGSRWISVYIPRKLFRLRQVDAPGVQTSLVWGGLRGGISIALALSVPPIPQRNMIVLITYIVVIFSIVVQGLSFKSVLKKSTAQTI